MDAHPGFAQPVLLREDRGAIALLTLNRPAARNALSDGLIEALGSELDLIRADRTIRAVVLAGAGPAFCAGHDLKEMTARRADPDRGRAYFAELIGRCSATMQRIVRLPQPVIAAVEGIATAAGCQLVASADLAIAGAQARFATPGVQIGLFCSTPMVALSRNVSPKHALEMLLLGEMADATEAARIGLVNRVVPAGRAIEEAMTMAAAVASKSSRTISVGKVAFYEQLEMPLADAYGHVSQVMVENMLTLDAEEGIGAFVEKRQPVWSHT